MQFIVSTTDEVLVPQAGLALVGALLQDTKLRQRVNALYHAHGTSEQFHSEIKSDMDLMYLAAKLVRHANRWQVVLWQNSNWGAVWRGLYARFCGAPRVRSG